MLARALRHTTELWVIAGSLAIVAGIGCGGDPPPEPEPARPRGRTFVESQPEPEPAAAPAPASAPLPPKPAPTAPLPAAVLPKAEEKPPREYSAELTSAVGSIESCMKPRLAGQATPEKASVSLEAYALESGSMSRGYARSSDLTPEELECVKTRVEHAHIPPGVEQAPRRIDATVTLTFKRPEPSGAPAPAPSAQPAAPSY